MTAYNIGDFCLANLLQDNENRSRVFDYKLVSKLSPALRRN